MAIHYFEDQSWLDLLLLTLPVVVPLLISIYIVLTEQPRPKAHANPLPTYNDTRASREQLEHVIGPALNFLDTSNPRVRRRLIARPTSPLPFEDGVYMPEPRRSSRAERRRINESDLIHREYIRQSRNRRSQYQDFEPSEIVPMQEPDIPEIVVSHQDPWIPDDFRLPAAIEEEEQPSPDEHTFVSVDRSRNSSWEVVSDAEEREWQHVKPHLRGGGGDEPVALRSVRVRMTEEELREHISRNRAETLAVLEYYSKASVRARERDDRPRR